MADQFESAEEVLEDEPIVEESFTIDMQTAPPEAQYWMEEEVANDRNLGFNDLAEAASMLGSGKKSWMAVRVEDPASVDGVKKINQKVVFNTNGKSMSSDELIANIDREAKSFEAVAGKPAAHALAGMLNDQVSASLGYLSPDRDLVGFKKAVVSSMEKQGIITAEEMEALQDPDNVEVTDQPVDVERYKGLIRAGLQMARNPDEPKSRQNILTAVASALVDDGAFTKAGVLEKKHILDRVVGATAQGFDAQQQELVMKGIQGMSDHAQSAGKEIGALSEQQAYYTPTAKQEKEARQGMQKSSALERKTTQGMQTAKASATEAASVLKGAFDAIGANDKAIQRELRSDFTVDKSQVINDHLNKFLKQDAPKNLSDEEAAAFAQKQQVVKDAILNYQTAKGAYLSMKDGNTASIENLNEHQAVLTKGIAFDYRDMVKGLGEDSDVFTDPAKYKARAEKVSFTSGVGGYDEAVAYQMLKVNDWYAEQTKKNKDKPGLLRVNSELYGKYMDAIKNDALHTMPHGLKIAEESKKFLTSEARIQESNKQLVEFENTLSHDVPVIVEGSKTTTIKDMGDIPTARKYVNKTFQKYGPEIYNSAMEQVDAVEIRFRVADAQDRAAKRHRRDKPLTPEDQASANKFGIEGATNPKSSYIKDNRTGEVVKTQGVLDRGGKRYYITNTGDVIDEDGNFVAKAKPGGPTDG